jgi:hypothetical protein
MIRLSRTQRAGRGGAPTGAAAAVATRQAVALGAVTL